MIALLATERPLDYFVPSSQLDGFLDSQIPLSHSSPSWLSKIYRTTLHCTDAKKNSALVAAWRPNSWAPTSARPGPAWVNPRPPGGGGEWVSDPNPPRFFLNNVRSVTGIGAKLGTILRPYTKFGNFLFYTDVWPNGMPFVPEITNVWKITKNSNFKQNAIKKHQQA